MGENRGDVRLQLPTVREGDNPGSDPIVVMRLQHILNDRGHGPLVEDGEFGLNTEAAVKKFQGNEGIGTDGVVGPQTWTSLLTIWLLSSEAC